MIFMYLKTSKKHPLGSKLCWRLLRLLITALMRHFGISTVYWKMLTMPQSINKVFQNTSLWTSISIFVWFSTVFYVFWAFSYWLGIFYLVRKNARKPPFFPNKSTKTTRCLITLSGGPHGVATDQFPWAPWVIQSIESDATMLRLCA